jgi:type I restriction enzyme S subunit
MGCEGQTVLLAEAMDKIIDHRGRTPKKLGGEFADAGVPVISAKNIRNGRLVLNEVRYVDESLAERWMPEPLQLGDVLLTSEAPLGEAAYLKNGSHYVLGQRLFALRPNPETFHSRYLYYLLRWGAVRRSIDARATGTTAQGIRQSELQRVRLPVAPLPVQRAIAGVLGPLDDKIDLLDRQSQNLESMVRATIEGLLTREDATSGVLDDAVEFKPRLPLGKGEVAYYLDMASMPSAAAIVAPKRRRAYTSGARYQNGDVLLARITPCLENGKLAVVGGIPDGELGWGSTEFLTLRPRSPVPKGWVYWLASIIRAGAERRVGAWR